jgi:hypothetical protein
MNAQSLGSLNRDSFGIPLWESREKVPFGCKCGGEAQSDALLSSSLNPLEGPSVLNCRIMELGGAPNFQH